MHQRLIIAFLLMTAVLAGCRATAENLTIEDVIVDVALDNENPTVGTTDMLVTVTRDDGTPIDDATVTVNGTMNHAGMVPFEADSVTENTEGVYTVPVEFSMGGDWIFDITVELPNGETTVIEYEIDGVAGDGDMDMDDMEMSSGGVSAAYMTITNNTDTDITLESVSAEGVGMVQIHETVVDDNDMASMQELEHGLVVEAGATVQLMPGGIHIMLMNFDTELVEGETLSLTLSFNEGEQSIEFDAPITSMQPENESGSVDNDGIIVADFWVRPTSLADMDMDDMDMEDDDDMSDMDMEDDDASELEEELNAMESTEASD